MFWLPALQKSGKVLGCPRRAAAVTLSSQLTSKNNNKSIEIVAYLWINSCRSGICAVKWRYCRVLPRVDRVTSSASAAFKLQFASEDQLNTVYLLLEGTRLLLWHLHTQVHVLYLGVSVCARSFCTRGLFVRSGFCKAEPLSSFCFPYFTRWEVVMWLE